MPLYEYKCTSCGHLSEIRHGFSENHEGVCALCGAALARVFSAAPIVFKGSGFYVTDSRKRGAAGSSSPAEGEAKVAETKGGPPKASEPKASGSKASESKASEPKGGDGTSTAGKSSEPAA
jgi:putative FmdB family regulatory protein